MESSSAMTLSNSASGEVSVSSSGQQPPAPPPPQQQAPASPTVKKKRNLPGMPDPDAEVIALSPKTLLATNRFVCEICNKGFQRDQNLQLHRRGHNLPWKLRQRNGKEPRKRVYVCPEASCVHHDPSRALGDLTGIKKHFCRKHGEKKWKCEKCSKNYAVQSDWKAHSKTCGTREYRCDCGTLFSRKDSFITHRAFCDALAEESAKTKVVTTVPASSPATVENKEIAAVTSTVSAKTVGSTPSAAVATVPIPQAATAPENKEPETTAGLLQYVSPPPPPSMAINSCAPTSSSSNRSTSTSTAGSLFASFFASPAPAPTQSSSFSDLIDAMSRSNPGLATEPPSLCLSSNGPTVTLFAPPPTERRQFAAVPPPLPRMSATALLQKAAQMGASSSNSSLLRGVGLAPTSTSSNQESLQQDNSSLQWHNPPPQFKPEPPLLSAGLGLGLAYDSGNAAVLTDLVMAPSLFVPKPSTLDFLGLGIGPTGSTNTGLSALITTMGSGLNAATPSASLLNGDSSPGKAWDNSDRKPRSPAIL